MRTVRMETRYRLTPHRLAIARRSTAAEKLQVALRMREAVSRHFVIASSKLPLNKDPFNAIAEATDRKLCQIKMGESVRPELARVLTLPGHFTFDPKESFEANAERFLTGN